MQTVNPDVFPLAKIYTILIEAGKRGKQKAPETGLVEKTTGDELLAVAHHQSRGINDVNDNGKSPQ